MSDEGQSGRIAEATVMSRNLKRLLQVRSALILCQAALVAFSFAMPDLRLRVAPLLAVLSAYAAVNVASIMLIRGREISGRAYFGQLVVDVVFLTLLFYLSGGYTNPFISLYLLPLFIASSTLPGRYAWSMAGLVLGGYSLLVFYYRPLFAMPGVHTDMGFHLHLVGMWLSFVFSVALIVFFIMRMSDALRERERRLAVLREQAARDELVVSLGALAAGAAHELGTPLATMAVVAGELADELGEEAPAAERVEIIRGQVRRCRQILSQISASAGQARAEQGRGLAVDAYIHEVVAQWRSIRPQAEVAVDMQAGQPPALLADVTLTQAIINLLNNAADAASTPIDLRCRWQSGQIEIAVCDAGQGLPPQLGAQIGSPFVSTKSGGRGLGLFLSRAAVERLGGSLALEERQPHGVCARLTLPVAELPV